MPKDRGLWPAYLSGGKLHPTTSAMTTPMNATLVVGGSSPAVSRSLPDSSELGGSSRSLPNVHEYAVTSTSDVSRARCGVVSVNRNEPGDFSISRTTSSPINLRGTNDIGDISRSRSEGGEHLWGPRSPSVTPRSSYSSPTEDDSDFEMDEQPTLNRTFNHKCEGSRGKTPEWDGLEMDMEM